MKIQTNKKINNINEESINSLKDFRQKQIETNIKYHIIFIFLLILINIGLIIFIIFYKNKINSIKSKTNLYNSQLNSKDETLASTNNILMHKLVNIASLNEYGLVRFSFIFEKSEEFKTIQNIIYDFRKGIDKKEIPTQNRNTFLLFQGMTDDEKTFIDRISYFWNLAIFIETINEKKFGIFIDDLITPDKNNGFQSNSTNIFIYSFETKKIYNYIGDGKKVLRLNKDGRMIIVGDDEIIIYDEYYLNGGEINFPLKSFDFSTVNTNVLTGENGKFAIKNIEAFCFSQLLN
jgi:hypothetical protein